MNRLPGLIASIESAGSVALIDVDAAGQRLTATLIGAGRRADAWHNGMSVMLLFAETEVALAKDLRGLISMRNRIQATVISIDRGSILSKIVLDASGHRLVSIITTRSCVGLALAAGDAVEALVKANEMSLVPSDSAAPITP